MRDGMPLWQAVASSGRDFKDLAWDNYILRMKGQEPVISTMEGTWTGYWARDQELGAKELFLYSKSDFYIPYRYLEEPVISTMEGTWTGYWARDQELGAKE